MEILKKIIAILLMSIAIVSCSKDEDETFTSIPRKNLLLKTTDSDGLISTYTYDGSNQLINYKLNGNTSNASRDYNFIYNADGTLDQIKEASGGALVMKYFYSTNKKVVKKEGRNGLDVYMYSYSGNTIIENYRFTSDNTGFRNIYTYDSNGDIIKVEYYTNASNTNPLGTYAATENRTYDDKKNAYESIPTEYLFPSSVHNLKSFQANSGGVYTSSYTYNVDNYPVKRVDSYTKTYEYKQL